MRASELIVELRNKGYSIRADGNYLDISPADLPPDVVQTIRQSKAEILAELQRETRRQKVIAMLEAAPGTQRAVYADTESDPLNVILTVAVRSCQQTCELMLPKAKYDPWKLLELIERHGQTTH